jgi:EmrB/QacA subfamily drug resistance transporter
MSTPVPAPDPRRWKALIFIGLAQLMVLLDVTIMNIALPDAQKTLGFSDGSRQWVITAYTLAFGGLLLFGGRVSDMFGRKRAFITGLIGFAAASALGSACVNIGMLLASRALQGMFGALLAPSALSLLSITFTDPKERAKAFGIFGAIGGGGGAIGLLLGGVLTQYLNWRWSLFVNVPFAVVAIIGAIPFIQVPAGSQNKNRLDIPGVLLATSGLVSLVYGFSQAESHGWGVLATYGYLIASAVLLSFFVLVESKVKAPLLPLRVPADRNRGGVFLALGLGVIALYGVFLLLTYYLQGVRGYSPLLAGVSFLPLVASMTIGTTQIGARLVNHVPARFLMSPGFLVAAAGLFLLAHMSLTSSYAGLVLPSLVLMGLGLGTAFMLAMSLATYGVDAKDAGVASAMVNTSQQVGGSIGTAVLNTVAGGAAAVWIAVNVHGVPTAQQNAQAVVHGYSTADYGASGILLLASLIALTFLNADRPGAKQDRPAESAQVAARVPAE